MTGAVNRTASAYKKPRKIGGFKLNVFTARPPKQPENGLSHLPISGWDFLRKNFEKNFEITDYDVRR